MGLSSSLLEVAERGRPGLGVLADPPVVDEADGDRVQEVELLAAAPPGDHQAGLLELLQVLHHPEARHGKRSSSALRVWPSSPEELVEQAPPGRIGQRLEHLVHAADNR